MRSDYDFCFSLIYKRLLIWLSTSSYKLFCSRISLKSTNPLLIQYFLLFFWAMVDAPGILAGGYRVLLANALFCSGLYLFSSRGFEVSWNLIGCCILKCPCFLASSFSKLKCKKFVKIHNMEFKIWV